MFMFFKPKVLKTKKKQNFFGFFILSIVVITSVVFILNVFIIQIYKVTSVIDSNKKNYYIIYLLKKDYKVNDFILAKVYETDLVIVGKVLLKGPVRLYINQNELRYNNKKILLKHPLPPIIDYEKSIDLKENEYFILSDYTIDSYFIGKIHHKEIIGSILFSF